jgi:sigma-B regulation protein RsbU (phosphoserine phosphatase)
MKILVAESNPASIKALQATLERWGYEVLTAQNGLEALDMLRNNTIDMVITDLMMSKMDGMEFCRKIRELDTEKYIYTIFLTAKEQAKDSVKMFEAGADDFLTKPFDREELRSRIKAGMRILEMENNLHKKNHLLKEANRKIMDDLKYAANIQKSFLPDNIPNIRGVDVCWEFLPCDQLGGDMLNVLRLDEIHYGIYVLDVSGHGISAALLSVLLSRLLSENWDILKIRTNFPPYYHIVPPKNVLESLNKQFPMDSTIGQYFTILYGIFNIYNMTFTWSNAGHPYPILIDENGAGLLTDTSGPPIGLFKEPKYQESQLHLELNQKVILCSDGILDAMNQFDQRFSVYRMKEILRTNRKLKLNEILSNLILHVGEWTRGKGGPSDDIILFGFEQKEV